MNKSLEGYAAYYQRALDLQVKGYKPVAGGTGLGKTHGAIQCIKENQHERKFIYVAHRHNLLKEMAAKLEKEGIRYRYLLQNSDIIKLIFSQEEKYQALKVLLQDPKLKAYARYVRNGSNGQWKLDIKACNQIIEETYQLYLSRNNQTDEVLDALNYDQQFGVKCSLIFGFFKKVLFAFHEVSDILSKGKDTSAIDQFKFHQEDLSAILERHSIIFDLFPYWYYQQSDDIPVALVTIQKLFLGYFNGRKNICIHNEADKVIFLDEFEFLESEILKLIIQESKLDNPFTFISYFYHNMSLKLLDDVYLSKHSKIREKLQKLVDNIKKLQQKSFFPEIRFFGMKDEKAIDGFIGTGLYQTNYSAIERPIYLEIDQELKKYWLTGKSNEEPLTTFQLMRDVKRTTNNILQFYLTLKIDDEKMYYELIDDAFEKTDYKSYLNQLSYFAVLPTDSEKNSNKRTRINNASYLYHHGYGVYVLNRPHTDAEPNEVHLDFHMVNSSPEKCLLGLIRKNMVFGLSATAHFPRCLEHFNEDWIKEEIEYDADEKVHYLELDDTDLSIIKKLSQQKVQKRQNIVSVLKAEFTYPKSIDQLILSLRDDVKIPEVTGPHDYHIDRLKHFFGTLDWILANPLPKPDSIDSHLLFFNSIAQVRVCMQQIEKGYQFIESLQIVSSDEFSYQINYFGRVMTIVLFNSDAHKFYNGSDEGAAAYRHLFNRHQPVVFVTQYPSANNGVNLQYENAQTQKEEDFQTIHLLEAPHFYFSRGQNRTENDIKSDIWKLSQLVLEGKIPREFFSQMLRKITTYKDDLNRYYKTLNDYTLNQVAKTIQALGRVERTRELVGLQRGRVADSVIKVFGRYFHNLEIQETIAESNELLSKFIHQFVAEIYPLTKTEFSLNNKTRPDDILTEDEKFRVIFISKLANNSEIANSRLTGTVAEEHIKWWYDLRKAALSLDIESAVIRNLHGTFFSTVLNKQKGITWWPKTGEVKPFTPEHPDPEAKHWDFNVPYRKLLEVDEVCSYFSSQGFPLEFKDRSNYKFFTPSFYQQVYLGALGEEACKAMFRFGEKPLKTKKPEEIDLCLFEIVDFVVPKHNWFVDAKFYSEANMLGLRGGELSRKIKKDVPSKLQKIREFNPKAKLVIINANSDDESHTSYFDQNFRPTDEDGADVIVFPGLVRVREWLERNHS